MVEFGAQDRSLEESPYVHSLLAGPATEHLKPTRTEHF